MPRPPSRPPRRSGRAGPRATERPHGATGLRQAHPPRGDQPRNQPQRGSEGERADGRAEQRDDLPGSYLLAQDHPVLARQTGMPALKLRLIGERTDLLRVVLLAEQVSDVLPTPSELAPPLVEGELATAGEPGEHDVGRPRAGGRQQQRLHSQHRQRHGEQTRRAAQQAESRVRDLSRLSQRVFLDPIHPVDEGRRLISRSSTRLVTCRSRVQARVPASSPINRCCCLCQPDTADPMVEARASTPSGTSMSRRVGSARSTAASVS